MNLGALKQKLTGKGTQVPANGQGDKSIMSFDMLYQLSYMSVIAAAGVPRNLIFGHAGQLPCAPAEYFRRVELARQRLRYDYAKACRVVGETAQEEEIKGLLLRFSTSLISGEPESEFLGREWEAQAEAYDNEYGRKLEALKMWSDAYVSLILSAVLVIIVGVVATMIWEIETAFIVGLAAVSVSTTALGVWLIFIMSPREISVLRQAGSTEQRLVQRWFKLLLPFAVLAGATLGLRGGDLGLVLLVIAALIAPIGFISARDDKKVTKRDGELGSFLGSLGGVSAAIGTTVKEALGRIDLDAVNILRVEVKRLHTRLLAGIRAKLCWRRFIEETGSELANRSVGMFYDAIELGGDASQAGYRASLFASKVAALRAKRKTISTPFLWLCLAMHASVVVLLVFVTEVMTIFGGMIAKATGDLPQVGGAPSMGAIASFNFAGLEIMHALVLPLVVLFTVANALAPSVANGGSRYNMLYNLAITAGISGVSLVVLPIVAKMLFQSIQL
ncbi:MAG: hypothetical protein V1780_03980 [Chloroflexota bacterium]